MEFVVYSSATRGDMFDNICCAVTYTSTDNKYTYWYSKGEGGEPVIDFRLEDKRDLAKYLIDIQSKAILFGWATQSFHLPLLHKESKIEEVTKLADSHIDLQFDLLDNTGTLYPLAGVARALGLQFDPNMSKQSPGLWNSGDRDSMRKVILHVKDTVAVVVKIIETCYPKEGDNQLPLSLAFEDASGKRLSLPMTGLPISYSKLTYRGVKKHALQTPYVKALDWVGTWN